MTKISKLLNFANSHTQSHSLIPIEIRSKIQVLLHSNSQLHFISFRRVIIRSAAVNTKGMDIFTK